MSRDKNHNKTPTARAAGGRTACPLASSGATGPRDVHTHTHLSPEGTAGWSSREGEGKVGQTRLILWDTGYTHTESCLSCGERPAEDTLGHHCALSTSCPWQQRGQPLALPIS